MSRIYLDHAAATPMNKQVFAAMQPYFSDVFYNPSALYEGARSAKNALEEARQSVARSIGARPSEVVFTAGGTESANLAIHGVMSKFPDGEVIISAVEHDAVRHPAQKYSHRVAPVDEAGRLKIAAFQELLSDKTVLISVMLVNNEVGTIQPIKELADIVRQVNEQRRKQGNRMPLYLHTDACQAPLYLDINAARLGVDMMTLNGGKIHGPKQSGILYKKSSVLLEPLIAGGGQEWGLRSGTENVAFAVGLGKALEMAVKKSSVRAREVSALRDMLMQQIEEELGGDISGHRKHRVANNVHAIFPGSDNERVLFALDDMGIDAATGSACSASSDTSSHVLLAMGKTDEQARSSIRMSLGTATTKEEIVKAITGLKKALKA